MEYANSKVIVILGCQGGGKSTVVAGITGIYLGTPTTTAVEWHISPSATWSATVSIGHYKANDSSPEVAFTDSRPQVGGVCSSPLELASLLRKAERLVLRPEVGLTRLFSNENQRMGRPLLTHAANASYGGIIYVTLKYPEVKFKEVRILDTPGLVDGIGYPLENIHTRKLVLTYCTQSKPIMAVVLPSSKQKRGIFALSFAESIAKDPRRMNVIYTYLDGPSLPPLKTLRKYQHFYVRLCTSDSQGPFAVARCGIQHLRQEETAFFQLCEPWASRSKRDNLGVANILKAWGSPEPSFIQSLLVCSLGLVNETRFTIINVPSVSYAVLFIFVVYYFMRFAVHQLSM